MAVRIVDTKCACLINVTCNYGGQFSSNTCLMSLPRPHIKDIFQSIAAHVGKEPCCDWVGS